MSFAYYLPYLYRIHLKWDEGSGYVGGFELASQEKLTYVIRDHKKEV